MLALFLLLILIVIVGQLVFTVDKDVRVAQNTLRDFQNEKGVQAGLLRAQEILKADVLMGTKNDTLDEAWARGAAIDVGPTHVDIRIEDEERRLCIAALGQAPAADAEQKKLVARLKRLIQVLDIRDEIRDSVVERIVDFTDKDTSGAFERGAKNSPLFSPDELLMADGFTETLLYGGAAPDGGKSPGLIPYVSLYPPPQAAKNDPGGSNDSGNPPGGNDPNDANDSNDSSSHKPGPGVSGLSRKAQEQDGGQDQPPEGNEAQNDGGQEGGNAGNSGNKKQNDAGADAGPKVNINTAGREVLMALSPDLTAEMADAILQCRQEPDAKGRPKGIAKEDLPGLPSKVRGLSQGVYNAIKPLIDVQSRWFTITLTTTTEPLTRKVAFVVLREGGQKPKVLLKARREVNDYLSIPKPKDGEEPQ